MANVIIEEIKNNELMFKELSQGDMFIFDYTPFIKISNDTAINLINGGKHWFSVDGNSKVKLVLGCVLRVKK